MSQHHGRWRFHFPEIVWLVTWQSWLQTFVRNFEFILSLIIICFFEACKVKALKTNHFLFLVGYKSLNCWRFSKDKNKTAGKFETNAGARMATRNTLHEGDCCARWRGKWRRPAFSFASLHSVWHYAIVRCVSQCLADKSIHTKHVDRSRAKDL